MSTKASPEHDEKSLVKGNSATVMNKTHENFIQKEQRDEEISHYIPDVVYLGVNMFRI